MLFKPYIVAQADLFNLPDLFLIAPELILQRLDKIVNRLLAPAQLSLGFDLKGRERRAGQLQKGFIVLLERLPREHLERGVQFLPRLLERRFLLLAMFQSFVMFRLRNGAGLLRLGKVPPKRADHGLLLLQSPAKLFAMRSMQRA